MHVIADLATTTFTSLSLHCVVVFNYTVLIALCLFLSLTFIAEGSMLSHLYCMSSPTRFTFSSSFSSPHFTPIHCSTVYGV